MKYKFSGQTFNTLKELREALNDSARLSDEAIAREVIRIFETMAIKNDLLDWLDWQRETEVCAVLEKARSPRMFSTFLLGEDSPRLERILALLRERTGNETPSKVEDLHRDENRLRQDVDTIMSYVRSNAHFLPQFLSFAFKQAYVGALEKVEWQSETDQTLDSGIQRMVEGAHGVAKTTEFRRKFFFWFRCRLPKLVLVAHHEGITLDDAVRNARKHFQSLNWTEKESDFILGECSASESKLLSGLSDAFTRSDIVKDVITEMVRVFRESQKEGQERDRKARAEWAKGNVKKVAKNALLMTIPGGVLFTRDSDYSPEPTRSWTYWGEVGMSCKNESLCAGLGDEKILGVVSAALSYTETHDALMAALKESITELRRKECFSK